MSDESSPEVGLPAIAISSRDGVAYVLVAPLEGDFEPHPVVNRGKGAAVRFAVGRPGRRGAVWRMWAGRGTDDVYLASRHTAGEVKVSLHQSGDWRIQIVEPDRPKTVVFGGGWQGTEGRVLHRWDRPEPNPVGWAYALSIVLPEAHLVAVPNDTVRWDDVRWCPSPNSGEQVEFQVWIVKPHRGVMCYDELVLEGGHIAVMDALELSSGNVAVVLALTAPTTIEEAAVIARCEELCRQSLPPSSEFDRSPELGPRHLVSGDDRDGGPRFYDLAFLV